ncbi:MAG TPA: hypothetical protein VFY23_06790 [Candidatus Limnocylindrales bacterium]|nr:hypothetical protein [Candidatus Limnocylindrales bacterium]
MTTGMTVMATDFEVEELYDLPEGCAAGAVTAEGVVCGMSELPGGWLVTWGDRVRGPFHGILGYRDDETFFWSADGCHRAFIAVNGDDQFVVRDDTVEGPFEGTSGSVRLVFSDDGRHLAYGVKVGDGYQLRVDGEVRSAGAELAAIQPVFSPDGERLAWAEMREAGRGRETRVVVDGEPGPWVPGLRNARGALRFSPDSRRFAYYRLEGGGHARWVLDGREQQVVNDVHPIGLAQMRGVGVLDPPLMAAFSPDSRRFAYWADVLEKGVAVVEDGVAGPILERAGAPVFSSDSRRLAYAGRAFDKRAGLVVDGSLSDRLPIVAQGLPTFSPDDRRVALSVETEEGGLLRKRHHHAMLVDGQLLGAREGSDGSMRPTWSADSRHVCWWMQSRPNEVWALRDGEATGPLAGLWGEPVFMSAGRLVYAAGTAAGASVFIDGQAGPICNAVTYAEPPGVPREEGMPVPMFRLSPDSAHVAWAGLFGSRQRPVLDGCVGPAFDIVVGSRFDPDGTARWWAQRGTTVCVVSARP